MINSPFAWNEFYEKQEVYNPLEPLEPAYEKAFEYLAQNGGIVLDFGCGNGRMALRILGSGARQIIGLDASYHGISLARRAGLKAFSSLQTKWLWGSVDSLVQLPDGYLKGVLLSNILGYLDHSEIDKLAIHLDRLLDQEAKVVIMEHQDDAVYKTLADQAANRFLEVLDQRISFNIKEASTHPVHGNMAIHYGTYRFK